MTILLGGAEQMKVKNLHRVRTADVPKHVQPAAQQAVATTTSRHRIDTEHVNSYTCFL